MTYFGVLQEARASEGLYPRLPILLLLDGLYANGPIMAQCHKHRYLKNEPAGMH
jgi:hypothetical protein